jgi:hypothetical protein
MRIITAFILILISVQSLFAQRFSWATSGGYAGIANSFNGAIDIARDPEGNIYTMDFGNGNQQCQGDTISPFSSYTAFIYKFNPQGQLLLINRIGALSGNFYPYNLETDDGGNLYVLGQPTGVNFIIVNEDTISAIGNTNQLIKIDGAGNFVWKHNTGFAGNGEGCMLQYSNGYIYFQSGKLSVSKINAAGAVQNTLTASYYSSPTASTGIIFKGSGIFSNSDLLFAAYSRGIVAYGTDTLLNSGNPFLTAPVLLIRCDSDLTIKWARYLSNTRDPDQNFIPVAVDSNDNVYTAVQVNQEMIIGNDTIKNPNGSFIGEGAIVKVDAAGNDVWAKALVSTNSSLAWCMQKVSDNSGILIGGRYTGKATFGSFSLTNGSNSLPFIAKIDFNGNFTNAFNYLKAPAGSDANCLLADGNGNYLVGGKLPNNTVPVFSCTPISGVQGFYLGSFREQPDSVPTPSIVVNGLLLTATPAFSGDIKWYLNGNILNDETGQTLDATQSGNYTVEYSYTTGCVGSQTSAIQEVKLTSVKAIGDNGGIFIYPNPSQGLFQLSGLDKNQNGINISIKNLQGVAVYNSSNYTENQLLNITNVATGVYFIEVVTEKEVFTIKLLKQ